MDLNEVEVLLLTHELCLAKCKKKTICDLVVTSQFPPSINRLMYSQDICIIYSSQHAFHYLIIVPYSKILFFYMILKTKVNFITLFNKLYPKDKAKRFNQIEGINYLEIFSPIFKMYNIHIHFSLIASHNLYLHQLDVSTAFI